MAENASYNAQRKRKEPSSSSPTGIRKTKQLKPPIVIAVNSQEQNIPDTSSAQVITDYSSDMESSQHVCHYPESNAPILKGLLPTSSGGHKKQSSNYSVDGDTAIESNEIFLSVKQNALIENNTQELLNSEHLTDVLIPDKKNTMSVGPIDKNRNTTLVKSGFLSKITGIISHDQTAIFQRDTLPESDLSTASPGGDTYASIAKKNRFMGIPVTNSDLENKLSPSLGISIHRAPNTTIADYADAITESIGEANLSHISPVSGGRAIAFVTNVTHAQSLVIKGLVVKGQLVMVSHLRPPATKIVLSNVYPIISRGDVIRAMSPYGNVIPSSFRDIRASTRQKDILSFRKEVLFIPKPNIQIPSAVVVSAFDYKITVYISTEGLKCSTCSRVGHPASKCHFGDGNPMMTTEATTKGSIDIPAELTSIPTTTPEALSKEVVAGPSQKSIIAEKTAVTMSTATISTTEGGPRAAILNENEYSQLLTTKSQSEVSLLGMEISNDEVQDKDQGLVSQTVPLVSQDLNLPVIGQIASMAGQNFSHSDQISLIASQGANTNDEKPSSYGVLSPDCDSDERSEQLSDHGSVGSISTCDISLLPASPFLYMPLTIDNANLLVQRIHGVRKFGKRRSIVKSFTSDFSGLYSQLLAFRENGLLWQNKTKKRRKCIQSVLDHLLNTVVDLKASTVGMEEVSSFNLAT